MKTMISIALLFVVSGCLGPTFHTERERLEWEARERAVASLDEHEYDELEPGIRPPSLWESGGYIPMRLYRGYFGSSISRSYCRPFRSSFRH